jgi:hypothetical protein
MAAAVAARTGSLAAEVRIEDNPKGPPTGSTKIEDTTRPAQSWDDLRAGLDALTVDAGGVVLVNLAHEGLRTHSDAPAIRILGTFKSPAAARGWLDSARRMLGTDPTALVGEVYAWPLGRFGLVPLNAERLASQEYTLGKVDYQLSEVARRSGERLQEFQGNRVEHKTGETGVSAYRRWEESRAARAKKRADGDAQRADAGSAPRIAALPDDAVEGVVAPEADVDLPAVMGISGQSVAVVSVIHDVEDRVINGDEPPEPSVAVFGTFRDADAANKWIEDAMDRTTHYVDVEVVETQRWLFPDDTDLVPVERTYTHDKLDEFMGGHRDSQMRARGEVAGDELKMFADYEEGPGPLPEVELAPEDIDGDMPAATTLPVAEGEDIHAAPPAPDADVGTPDATNNLKPAA